jgi:hypothetical protein
MYTYAYVYKKEDYLINVLYDKLDPEYIDVPPEKTNPKLNTGYDKSIYFACKYLIDTQFKYLSKNGILRAKMVSEERFFRQISDFKSAKLDRDLINEEKKLSRQLGKLKENKGHRKEGKKTSDKTTGKTVSKSITYVAKKVGKKKVLKKVASKSTIH